ncbi:MAG: tRNA pseudouridine(55) synthase TruB, partial [Aquiluna sp.]
IEVMGEIQSGRLCQFEIEVDCSSGTYIRAIARDLGEKLGVGGHLSALRRLSIGPFSVDESSAKLLPPAEAARRIMPGFEITQQQAIDLRHGKQLEVKLTQASAAIQGEQLVAIVEPHGQSARSLAVFPEESDA